MHLYYAMGGGLGHLVRARAVAHTLGLESDTWLLTSSPHAADPRVTGSMRVCAVPPELDREPIAWRRWLERTLQDLRPQTLTIDTFPAGILGELGETAIPADTTRQHVARLLRPEVLPGLFSPPGPRFETCLVVEELGVDHRRLLETRARTCTALTLIDPVAAGAAESCGPILARHAEFWLVVHSGPADEVAELLQFAAELRTLEDVAVDLIAVTRDPPGELPARTYCHDLFPATPLFAHARRIFTAGGFNAMRQTAPWRNRHTALPFPRRYDDQYGRVARAGAAPAGEVFRVSGVSPPTFSSTLAPLHPTP